MRSEDAPGSGRGPATGPGGGGGGGGGNGDGALSSKYLRRSGSERKNTEISAARGSAIVMSWSPSRKHTSSALPSAALRYAGYPRRSRAWKSTLAETQPRTG